MRYRNVLRPLVFYTTRHNPELAHDGAMRVLEAISAAPPLLGLLRARWVSSATRLQRTVCGIRFPNPVGLAAGYAKNGEGLPALAALGFGHIEVGTVTWHAQAGNPRPRLFRLYQSEALINRMGFNNAGAAALAARLQRYGTLPVPIGISL
ncbi:MAG: dihydroorotate dehydrogenase (quinone), partial [Chloroflexaceae bacterium]|nr:dihydroorotate dehydrogenase (quinone) [Chloroflexaceae bacterium]